LNDKLRFQAKTFIILTFISLTILLIFSLLTIRDVWECELDENSKTQSNICSELRRSVSCKTTVAPPIRAEVILRINNTIKASAFAFCGWDTAVSEIRLCFIILNFMSIYFGIKAIYSCSKKNSDIVTSINLQFSLFTLRYFFQFYS